MNKLRLDTFLVPGYGLTISNSFQIASEDLSGKSSSTATAENGFKPKTFAVSIKIRFSEKRDLSDLMRKAESVGANGERTIYTAAHPLLDAMNVRQVRFTDTFSVTPESGKQCWGVSFTLKEYDSAAERMEARTTDPSKTAQKGSGAGVVPGAIEPGTSAAVSGNSGEAAPLTDTEKVLKKLDDFLGNS